jgi:hypothetical protein
VAINTVVGYQFADCIMAGRAAEKKAETSVAGNVYPAQT